FGEQVIRIAAADDAYVFDPVVAMNRVFGETCPMQSVARGGVAEKLDAGARAVVAGEPELVGIAVAKNPAAFAYFHVPVTGAFGGENRVLGSRGPMDKLGGEIGGCLVDAPLALPANLC